MRGVTLLEFLAGVFLFLLLLFFSYHAFDVQRRLQQNILARTEPENESNYRLLLIKHLVERSSQYLRVDPFLEEAPVFFPDLSFGKNQQNNAFSVIQVTGVAFPFTRTGNIYKFEESAVIGEQKTYLLAGSDRAANYTWNYARAEQVRTTAKGLSVRFNLYTLNPEPETGRCIEVEVHGFLFQDQTLYSVSPGGALQPFLSPLDSFEYIWNNRSLTIRWKIGLIGMEFRCAV